MRILGDPLDLPKLDMFIGSSNCKSINEESKKLTKKHWKCFDIPDIGVRGMGTFQVIISMSMIFVGIMWSMLHQAITTYPAITDTCQGWPKKCGKYYGLDKQKTYVMEITIWMSVAGCIGLLGGVGQSRILLILALAFTIVPFMGIIENGIFVLGTVENVRSMCDDTSLIETIWGDCWDCNSQIKKQERNIVFMVSCSILTLVHLWVCLRFSEKLQLFIEEKESKVDTSIGAACKFLCFKGNPMREYFFTLLLAAFFIFSCGVAQIVHGVQATNSTQEAEHENISMVLLDNPQFKDEHFIYGSFAIMTAGFVVYFLYHKCRSCYYFTFCLLVQTLSLGYDNGVWHGLELRYGLDVMSLNSTNIASTYPVYINDEARDKIYSSKLAYYTCNITCVLAIFIGMLASEAIQDLERMLNDNSKTKMRRMIVQA